MAIRDVSGLPDDDPRVPDWVRRARERERAERRKLCACNLHFGTRAEVLNHCDTTGHKPLVAYDLDPFLKRS